MEIKKRKKCALCKAKLVTVLNLGKLPLANHLLTRQELSKKEKKYPLTLCFCESCGFLQLGQIVSPKVMYEDYLYVPSISKTLVNHFENLKNSVLKIKKGRNSVLDIGSNDGTLLKFFKPTSLSILGVDPAIKIAEAATLIGIPTLPICFNFRNARKIAEEYGKFDVVTGTNVFAHIENLYDLYAGVSTVLKDDGICVFEVSYLLDMIRSTLFDSIYHEHLYYFSVSSLKKLFEKTDLEIFNIERVQMHGGSLRVWLKKKKNEKITINTQSIDEFVTEEKKFGLLENKTFAEFSKRILLLKKKIIAQLVKLKKQNKRIVGFGAPAKGNVLLNFFGISKKQIDYIVDSTSYKQFRYTPGTRLLVLPEDTIYIEKPDFLFVLAWNFSEEVVKKHSDFKGKFIIPLPKLKII